MSRLSASIFTNKFLDVAGNGNGAVDFAVDASASSVDYLVTAKPNEKLFFHQIRTSIFGSAQFSQAGFGSISALSVGIQFFMIVNGVTILFPDTIKRNADWAIRSQNLRLINWQGGSTLMTSDFMFSDSGRSLVIMPGDSFGYRVNDDLSGLEEMYAYCSMFSQRV